MSALTLSVLPVPVARPSRRTHLRVVAPDRTAPAVPRLRGPAAVARPAPLRITRRGRLTVTVLVSAVLSVATVSATGVPELGVPGPQETLGSQSSTSTVVLPGQTLWQIAAEVDPDADRRDVIAEILALNDLETSQVMAGQILLLPAA